MPNSVDAGSPSSSANLYPAIRRILLAVCNLLKMDNNFNHFATSIGVEFNPEPMEIDCDYGVFCNIPTQSQETPEPMNFKESDWEPMEWESLEESSGVGEKDKRSKRFGIPNLGNTCYRNSVFQMLLELQIFKESVTSRTNDFNEALRAFIHCTEVPVKNSDLLACKNLLDLAMPNFSGGLQYDAHEYLLELLWTLCIKTHFNLMVESVISCSCGNYHNVVSQTETGLSIIVDTKEIKHAISKLFLTHVVDDFSCPSCKKSGRCVQQTKLKSLPEILIVQLKRFQSNGKKIKTFNPVETVLQLQQQQYKLVSVISHLGDSINCGHYLTSVMNPDESYDHRWTIYDDTNVFKSPCFWNDAYVLLYQKV